MIFNVALKTPQIKISLDLLFFVLSNVFFSWANLNLIIVILWNGFYLHRIALANHYAQHYLEKSILYRFLGALLILGPNSKSRHMDHHRFFNTKKDPDYLIYNPTSNIFIHLLKILSLTFFFMNPLSNKQDSRSFLNRVLVLQIILFFGFWCLYKNFYAYVIFLLFPLLVAKIINDLRVFVEHYDLETRSGSLKAISGIPFFGYFLSAYGFEDHKAHHLKPSKEELNFINKKNNNNYLTELLRILRHG